MAAAGDNRTPQTTYGGNGLSVPWREYISDKGQCGDLVFGTDKTTGVLIIDVQWSDLELAAKEILGWVEGIPQGGLLRKMPLRHPRRPQLYAREISKVEPIRFTGQTLPAGGGAYSDYLVARLTVGFWTPTYNMLPNGLVKQGEHERFVDRHWDTNVVYLNHEKGSLVFSEGTSSAGTEFAGTTGFTELKTRLNWTWRQVPSAIMNSITDLPDNIHAGAGKVNMYEWGGFRAGTLLCEAPKVINTTPPYPAAITANNDTRTRLFDIAFSFLYFDPPTTGTSYGHNLMPQKTNRNLRELVHSKTGITKSITTTAGFNQVTVVSSAGDIVQNSVVVGSGIPNDSRLFLLDTPDNKGWLSNPATTTATRNAIFYPCIYETYDFRKLFRCL